MLALSVICTGLAMHDHLNAIFLGIVEGLTEFLPVSSTAHLLIAQDLLGFNPPWRGVPHRHPVRRDPVGGRGLLARFWSAGRPADKPEARQFALAVIVAFLPAAVIGAALHRLHQGSAVPRGHRADGDRDHVDPRRHPHSGLRAHRAAPRYIDGDSCRYSKALQIGLCQVLAIIPGVSRSGATILGGELLGVERKAAAAFHILSRGADDAGRDRVRSLQEPPCARCDAGIDIAVGFVVSFIVAYFVVKTFIGFIGRYGLKPFGWYRIAAGLALIAVLTLR